jgi:hypothetical protein
MVFWVMTPYSLIYGFPKFRRDTPPLFTLKMEAITMLFPNVGIRLPDYTEK